MDIDPKNFHILIVDDQINNIHVIGSILTKKGFVTSIAQNGKEAVTVSETSQPDLILLDIVMPEMDGFQTCSILKENPATKNIPIIFLSALSDAVDKVEGFRLGAIDYITKPIHKEELFSRIITHLTIREYGRHLEEKIAERTKALQKSEAKYRTAIASNPEPMTVTDVDGNISFVNAAFTQTFGWTVTTFPSDSSKFIPEDHLEKTEEMLRSLAQKGKIIDYETQRYDKGGKILDVSLSAAIIKDINGNDIGIITNLRDITQFKRTQEILIQNEKMMSLGGFAGGMAHEINNMLFAIMQNADLLKTLLFTKLPKNTKIAEECHLDFNVLKSYVEKLNLEKNINAIAEAGQRTARLVENMLSFSRNSTQIFSEVDIRELIDTTIELLNNYKIEDVYPFKSISLVREYTSPLPRVNCASNQIQQVFLNILKNGAEAMQEAGIPAPCFKIRVYSDNSSVSIEFEDNGPGMPEDVRPHVFKPFFTTKGGKGTGLGMSISYFIITKNHGGFIKATSTPGKGTLFTIHLPLKNVAS